MKTLFFEGAGCVPRGEVENCRIRTAFTNRVGKQIYLEMGGCEVTKNSPKLYGKYTNVGYVDHCFYITGDQYEGDRPLRDCVSHFEYTNANILSVVNSLNCSFDQVVVLPDLAGYRVHGANRGYNFGDVFLYDADLTAKRQEIHQHFYDLEKSEGKKYPNFSLWVDEDQANLLHLLRHFNGYNKHWTITITGDTWDAVESKLGRGAC